MSNQLEIPVPDLGDFAEVEVVEILVAVGDQVTAEATAGGAGKRQGNDGNPLSGKRHGQPGGGSHRR